MMMKRTVDRRDWPVRSPLVMLMIFGACASPRSEDPARGIETRSSALTTSAEIDIGGPVYLPNERGETTPGVASNGTIALVAWNEDANGLVFKRLDGATGAVLDPGGIPLGSYGVGDVAYGGGRFAIVGRTASRLHAFLLDASGETTAQLDLTDGAPTGPYMNHAVSVAWTGQSFLVVWGTATLYGLRFSPAGALLDAAPKAIGSTGGAASAELACGPTNCLSVSHYDLGPTITVATLINPTALTATELPRTTLLACCGERVVWDGAAYAVFGAPSNPTTIQALRIDATGTVLTPTPVDVLNVVGPAFDVSSNGTLTFFTMRRGTDVNGYFFSQDLTRVASASLDLVQAQGRIPSAFAGGAFVTAWTTFLDPHIYARRVLPDGTRLDAAPIPISEITADQVEPAIAFDGTNYLVAWVDARNRPVGVNPSSELFTARVTPAGSVLDPIGVRVEASTSLVAADPALAFGAGAYLAAWETVTNNGSTGIRLARIGTDAQPTGAFGTIPIPSSDPAVAFDGTQWAVAYNVATGPMAGWGIFVQRISAQGMPSGSPIRVSVEEAKPDSLSIASNGSGELQLTWSSGVNALPSRARLLADGTVAPAPALLCTGCSGADSAIAFGGGQYTAVWAPFNSTNYDLNVTRLVNGLSLDTGMPLCAAVRDQRLPSIAYLGSRFLVAWRDARPPNNGAFGNADIYAGRVTASGARVDGDGFPIATRLLTEYGAAVGAGPPGQALVAYTRAYANGSRLHARVVTDDAGCALATECPDDALACTQPTCTAGTCGQAITSGSCLIGGQCYANGAPNPTDACQVCRPTTSQTAFSPVTPCTGAGGAGGTGGAAGSAGGAGGRGGGGAGGSAAAGRGGGGGNSGGAAGGNAGTAGGNAGAAGGRGGNGGAGTAGSAGNAGRGGAGGVGAAGGAIGGGGGAGGTNGSAGMAGAGGTSGSSGAAGTTGGGVGTAGSGGGAVDAGGGIDAGGTSPGGGCGCETAQSSHADGFQLAWLMIAGAVACHRRRVARGRSRP
jgi:hypothetical protein